MFIVFFFGYALFGEVANGMKAGPEGGPSLTNTKTTSDGGEATDGLQAGFMKIWVKKGGAKQFHSKRKKNQDKIRELTAKIEKKKRGGNSKRKKESESDDIAKHRGRFKQEGGDADEHDDWQCALGTSSKSRPTSVLRGTQGGQSVRTIVGRSGKSAEPTGGDEPASSSRKR